MSNVLQLSSAFVANAKPTLGERAAVMVSLVQPLVANGALLGAERFFCGNGPSRAAYVPAVLLGTIAVAMVLAVIFSPSDRTFVFADDALTVKTPRQAVTIRRADVAAAITVGANVILATKGGMYLQSYIPADLEPLRSHLLAWSGCAVETRPLLAWNFFATSGLSTCAAAVAFVAPLPFPVRATFGVVFATSLLGWLLSIAQAPAALRRQKRTNAAIYVASALVAGTIFSRI